MVELFDAIRHLDPHHAAVLILSLVVAFGFEVVNGFHDTANAVTTVIYTRTLRPIPAVLYSGVCNFLGVFLGGTAIAFTIVHLLPVELLVNASPRSAIIMVLALLTSGMAWNLSTWWVGLPVSSSHTLIGAILGIGLAHGFLNGEGGFSGVNWAKTAEVGLSLLISPMIGFVSAAALLLAAKRAVPNPELYEPPPTDPNARAPRWIRGILIVTCGGVSLAHGSNDGQKGMGLIMLVLTGLLPAMFALNLKEPDAANEALDAARHLQVILVSYPATTPDHTETLSEIDSLVHLLDGKRSLQEIPYEARWKARTAIYQLERHLKDRESSFTPPDQESLKSLRGQLRGAIEYVPTWVVVGVALCLGIGTTIGYKRIVVTVAEKIGKSHLTYGQGAAAEMVAMATIGVADLSGLPVSTTHVLSSGVAGTMWANRSGVQMATIRTIALAWLLTIPAAVLLSSSLYLLGHFLLGR